MAKIKIVFEARYVSKKTGEAPLKIMVSHKTETVYIPLDISLKIEQWNGKEVIKHSRKKKLNDEIDSKLSEYKSALRSVEESCDIESCDVKTLRDLILNEINADKIHFGKILYHLYFKNF